MTQTETPFGGDLAQPSQISPHRLPKLFWLGLGSAAYATALLATLPAAFFINIGGIPASGSIWNGSDALPNGNQVAWHVQEIRSLMTISAAANWRLTGPDTDLTGDARMNPFGVTIENTTGVIDSDLALAVTPGLTLPCRIEARVKLRSLSRAGGMFKADGEMRSARADCSGLGPDASIPALVGTISSEGGVLSARLASESAPDTTLATATLAPSGRLDVSVRPEAAGVLPGLRKSALGSSAVQIETVIHLP